MREIRFRAWDVGDKEMYAPEIIVNGVSSVDSHGNILMQFTGLRDKNGKEIYEGDIVEYENSNAGYGRPRHEEISRDVVPSIFEHEKMSDGEIWWKEGTIIGNIYENPELVK